MSISIPQHLTPLLLTTLRLLPLLGATASLTHAYMEYITTSSFLIPAPTSSFIARRMVPNPNKNPPPSSTASPDSAHAAAVKNLDAAKKLVVPAWFTTFFTRAVWSVIGFNSLTTLSAVANLFLYPEGLGAAKPLYFTGLAGAVAHYAFVGGVTPSVEALVKRCVEAERGDGDREKEGEKRSARSWLTEWVGVHVWRMGSVDVLAWGCFFVGGVQVLSPGV